jgi:hypothetical protein
VFHCPERGISGETRSLALIYAPAKRSSDCWSLMLVAGAAALMGGAPHHRASHGRSNIGTSALACISVELIQQRFAPVPNCGQRVLTIQLRELETKELSNERFWGGSTLRRM